jgi:hypothetical protein
MSKPEPSASSSVYIQPVEPELSSLDVENSSRKLSRKPSNKRSPSERTTSMATMSMSVVMDIVNEEVCITNLSQSGLGTALKNKQIPSPIQVRNRTKRSNTTNSSSGNFATNFFRLSSPILPGPIGISAELVSINNTSQCSVGQSMKPSGGQSMASSLDSSSLLKRRFGSCRKNAVTFRTRYFRHTSGNGRNCPIHKSTISKHSNILHGGCNKHEI